MNRELDVSATTAFSPAKVMETSKAEKDIPVFGSEIVVIKYGS